MILLAVVVVNITAGIIERAGDEDYREDHPEKRNGDGDADADDEGLFELLNECLHCIPP